MRKKSRCDIILKYEKYFEEAKKSKLINPHNKMIIDISSTISIPKNLKKLYTPNETFGYMYNEYLECLKIK